MTKYFDNSHPMYVELLDKTRKITKHTRKVHNFKCRECNIIYTKMIARIEHTQKTACPHCGPKNRWCGNDDCQTCKTKLVLDCAVFKKAYRSGSSKDYKLYSKKSEAKLIFYCEPCDHTYTCRIVDFYCVSYTNKDKQTFRYREQIGGCNHCTRTKALCPSDKNCNICKKKKYSNRSRDTPHYFDENHPLFHELVDKSLKLTFGSRQTPLFKCRKCGLTYTKIINRIKTSQKTACYHCCRTKRLCGVQDCKTCKDNFILECPFFKKAYVSGLEENYKIYQKKSARKATFYCKECDHTYICKISDFYCSHDNNNIVLRDKPGGCNHCTRTLVMCKKQEESCIYCVKTKTCVGNAWNKVKQHYIWTDDKKQHEVTTYSHMKITLKCRYCDHDIKLAPSDFNRNEKSSCYMCSTFLRWKPCDNKKCEHCYNISFGKFIDDNNDKISIINEKHRDKYIGTNFKSSIYCKKCDKIHKRQIDQFTRNDGIYFCPYDTMWKTEKKMNTHLNKTFIHDNIDCQTRYEWCKKTYCLPYDFCVNDSIIIELDGMGHFKRIPFFHRTKDAFHRIQEYDMFKNKKAFENGYQLIRVFQEDYFKNRNGCVDKVDKAILNMKNNPNMKYCFIPSANKDVKKTYDKFKQLLDHIPP